MRKMSRAHQYFPLKMPEYQRRALQLDIKDNIVFGQVHHSSTNVLIF